MAHAKVILEFCVPDHRVSELLLELRDRSKALADSWQCPSLLAASQTRCEQDRNDHDAEQHTNGDWSWSVTGPDPEIEIGLKVIGNVTGQEFVVDSYDPDRVYFKGDTKPRPRVGFWDRYRLAE